MTPDKVENDIADDALDAPCGSADPTLFDQCALLDPKVVQQIVDIAGGAAYLVSPSALASNTNRLLQTARQVYKNTTVAYSYKTNYCKALINAARSSGAKSEVVSIDEFELAESLGVPDSQIIFNGPGKTAEVLRKVMTRPIVLIADSIGELHRIQNLVADGIECHAKLGIRVAPELTFQKIPSRFGIDLNNETNRKAISEFHESGLAVAGIHLHYTGDRSVESYIERIEFLIQSWNRLGLPEPEFIDCGGGYASAMPQAIQSQLSYKTDDLETYGLMLGQKMNELFPDQQPNLILEPGTGILSDVGVFVTPVVDVKRIDEKSIAVVDGTCFCLNPLRSTAAPAAFRLQTAKSDRTVQVAQPVTVYGNSCMEIDLHIEAFDQPVTVGDVFVFAQKGAYASCMSSPFIQGIPAVIAIDDQHKLELLRSRTDFRLLNTLN